MLAPVPPQRIEPAYRDREAVWSLVLRHGPYRLMGGLAGYGAIGDLTPMPWFREHWALDGKLLVDGVEPLLDNDLMIAAARRVFSAEVVRPATLLVNLMGPMAAGVPHVDTPAFRGLPRGSVPIWLLLVMGGSGLFDRWQLRVAGAVTWFYDHSDGEFEYWPRNLAGESTREVGPFGNVAVVTDSDRMFHRVGRIGTPEETPADSVFGPTAALHFDTGTEAVVLEGDRRVARYDPERIRVSLLWKAHVFRSREEARAFDAHSDDLSLEQVVEIFSNDLRGRGITWRVPSDPLGDAEWAKLLVETYRLPALERAL